MWGTMRRLVNGTSSERRGRRSTGPALVALSLGLALGAAACATAGRGSGEAEGAHAEEPAVLEVRNRNWQDMHIYVLAAGQRWSLGLVTSQSTQTWELPDGVFAANRDISFLADPIGSPVGHVSDRVLLDRGDRVEWTLHNRLSQSTIFVF